jgi:hypothetical protein
VTDPTRMRDQPALTQSSGLIWLVVGGIFAAIALFVLIALVQLPPPGVALVAAIIVAAAYAGMWLVRFVVAPGRRRLTSLMIGMLLIAAVSLGATVVVAASAG